LSQAKDILDRLHAQDPGYKFNVIYNEELLFEAHVSYPEILHWLESAKLPSFDLLAMP